MKPIFYLSILLSSLLLTSCYRKFDLEEYRTTPKMVINSAFSPDTVVMASISPHMVSLREQAGRDDSKRQGGIIYRRDLQGGDDLGKNIPNWKSSRWFGEDRGGWVTDTLYISNTVPLPGQTVKIVAFTPEYGTASAEDKIPSKTEIKGLRIIPRKEATGQRRYPCRWRWEYLYIEENDVLIYQITFQDTPGKSNYYSLQIWGDDDHLGVLLDFSVDPVFTQQQGILDEVFGPSMVNWRGRVFSDELFDGKEYTLQVKEQLRSDTKILYQQAIFVYIPCPNPITNICYLYKTSRMKVSWADLRM